jgi:hypothetical protein
MKAMNLFGPRRVGLQRFLGASALCAAVATLMACGGGATGPDPAVPRSPEPPSTSSTHIVTDKTDGTAAELRHRADVAMLNGDCKTAIEPLEALRAAAPDAKVLLDTGVCREALAQRELAEARYLEVEAQFAKTAEARQALFRRANLLAYSERWQDLLKAAEAILALVPKDDLARITGLGARALARIELGDDVLAMRDAQDGLDLMESIHYGTGGRLPVAAAQLRFALAEIRRVRSERITFQDTQAEAFLGRFEQRCTMLLDAQSAYTDAIRSEDPRWAAMSGFKVGEMYRVLHRDLMAIPPTKGANTKEKQQLFYAMMHVRYRVLLEKGGDMMDRTIALGEKLGDAAQWLARARATKVEIDKAIADEKATIAKLPYTEVEVQKALDILKKKVEDQQEKERLARQKTG